MLKEVARFVVLTAVLAPWAIGAAEAFPKLNAGAALSGPYALDPICKQMPPPDPPLRPGNPSPSTRKMTDLLRQIRTKIDPTVSGFDSREMVDQLQKQIAGTTSVPESLNLHFRLGLHQMNAGRPDSALNTYAAMDQFMQNHGGKMGTETELELLLRKGTAFFRLGEQENCLVNYNADSCLFPISSNAVHKLPRGSRWATEVFEKVLKNNPKDMRAMWLLNLSHMTLGTYPGKVDPKYLIPPDKFASEHEMPRFIDVSKDLGIDLNDLAGGTIVDDFDNDGYYDLVFSAWNWEGQLRFFRNNRDGTFSERTSEAGLVGVIAAFNLQQTDYNNDGHLDIWILRGGWQGEAGALPNSLLKNNGDGTFSEVTEEAGLLSFHPTQTSVWFDFNGDGWLDLFIGNESINPKHPHPSELYRNNKDGTFTECANETGLKVNEFVKGVTFADYNNDGRPDLFISTRTATPSRLFRNDGLGTNGHWKFTEVGGEAGVNSRSASFATFFFDYNNDGFDDLFVSGYFLRNGVGDIASDYLGLPHTGEKSQLFQNRGDGTFKDVSQEARLNRVIHTMGHNFGDLDNDGWLDFYCGTGDPEFRTIIPNRMYRNAGGKFFQDVTTATGTGHLQKGHGVSFADFDNDGDQDIYASMGGAYSGDYARNVLFKNPGGTNKWLKLKLAGVKSNKAAIGAKIKVSLQTPSGRRELYRTVSSGGSFGANPLQQEIGLGDAKKIIEVMVQWPGGAKEKFEGFELNSAYKITEGTSNPILQQLSAVKLGGK